jgi:predicted dehydrogenase
MKPVKVAMIGVGAISGIYLKNLSNTFRDAELVGLCDLVPEKAEKGAAFIKNSRKRIRTSRPRKSTKT